MFFISSFFLYQFSEFNWELPLAIAANLLVPYRIELGIDNLYDIHFNDVNGKGKFYI
jgi:hypothetical protein